MVHRFSVLYLCPQRPDDWSECGANSGKQSPDSSHDGSKQDALSHQDWRNLKLKHNFRKRAEVGCSRCDSIHRKRQQAAHDATADCQQDRLKHKRSQDTEAMETQYPQRRNFTGSIRGRRIHGIHHGETRANRHDDGNQISENLNGQGRRRLRFEVLLLAEHIQLHAAVAFDLLLNGFYRSQILHLDQERTVDWPFVFLGDLVVIAPDFRVVRGLRCIQYPHDVPGRFTDFEGISDSGALEALRHGPADNQLAYASSEHPSLCNLDRRPQFQGFRGVDSSHQDVRCISVDPWTVDDHDNLARDFIDAVLGFNDSLDVAIEKAVGFRLRSLPDHQQVQRISGTHKRILKSVNHRENRYENRDGQTDAQHRHQRSDAAHDDAAKIVSDGYHSPRLRTATAIGRREALYAGSIVLNIATASAMPTERRTVFQRTSSCCTNPLLTESIFRTR